MKIFKENDKIHFQLAEMDLHGRVIRMLADFTIPDDPDMYESLKNHIITNLNNFKP